MDAHVSWLRRRAATSVVKQLLGTFALVAAVVGGLVWWQTDRDWLVAFAVAVAAGQVAVVARGLQAMRSNALDHEFLTSYIEGGHELAVDHHDFETHHERCDDLDGFLRLFAIHDLGADPAPTFELLHTEDCTITATVSRASGSISLYSKLADGRFLVTDRRLILPNRRLIVNVVDDDTPMAMVAAHRAALERSPVDVVATPHALELIQLVHDAEHASYRQLGPWLGSFLNLDPHRRQLLSLTASPDPDEIFRLGLDDDGVGPWNPAVSFAA